MNIHLAGIFPGGTKLPKRIFACKEFAIHAAPLQLLWRSGVDRKPLAIENEAACTSIFDRFNSS